MHHEPTDIPTDITTDAAVEPTLEQAAELADAPLQLVLDLPDLGSVDPDDGAIDLSRFRLDEHTRELGRRQVALIKAQLAARAAQRAA